MISEINRQTSYECRQCGACCRWPGNVRISDDELISLALFMEMSTEEFTQHYTRLAHDRRGLSLIDAEDNACIMLDEANRCRIHAIKPKQCRDFPTVWSVDGYEKICRGHFRTDADTQSRLPPSKDS